MRPIAIVLTSGGMDSCVTAAMAAREFELALLHVNYGQRTQERELRAFEDLAAHYDVPADRRMVISIEHLARIGGSSLTDSHLEIHDAEKNAQGIPNTYVPFRNANLLSIAVSWAEVLGAEALFVGAVEEDSSGYPDCRESFYMAYQRVIETGTKNERPLRIHTPLIHLSKSEIIRQGLALKAPIHLSWSCYKNEERACGVCESCVLRLRGFHHAGAEDPIPYERYPSDDLLL
ncbi:MAG: 7-cyano-7-deazaguanine synthase QueC [Ignavibacteria bacterium]|nr:MAG: 7-cyano-7-deazaguanine synthase QueC [Ignavibacteria bacterium]